MRSHAQVARERKRDFPAPRGYTRSHVLSLLASFATQNGPQAKFASPASKYWLGWNVMRGNAPISSLYSEVSCRFASKSFRFLFWRFQRAREGKYEVRDPRSINPSRFYFRAHSTISKEKIVCPETRVRLENCFILVHVNHSDCVERQQSSNLNRLKGE